MSCSRTQHIDSDGLFLMFGLVLNVPVNSYGHVGTVSSPNHTFFLGKLDYEFNQYFKLKTPGSAVRQVSAVRNVTAYFVIDSLIIDTLLNYVCSHLLLANLNLVMLNIFILYFSQITSLNFVQLIYLFLKTH